MRPVALLRTSRKPTPMNLPVDVCCLNCACHYRGAFCPHCGQKASTRRYSVGGVKDQLVDKYKFYDNKELFTLKEIIVRPGAVIANYLAGRRVRYAAPIPLLAVAVGVMFTVSKQLNYGLGSATSAVKNLPANATNDDKLGAQMLDAFGAFYERTSDYTTLFSVLYASLITYLVFRKHKLHLGEHFIINAVATIGSALVGVSFFPLLKLTDDNEYLILCYLAAGYGFYYSAVFSFFKRFYASNAQLLWRVFACFLLGIIFDTLFIVFLFVLSSLI
jgi:Protein of unknown function (DUF3667)